MTVIERLRDVIAKANTYNMEINEITVSASQYDSFEAEARMTTKFVDEKCGKSVLRFNNVTINKRKCDGCCIHNAI